MGLRTGRGRAGTRSWSRGNALALPWFSVPGPRISHINILGAAASGSRSQDYITPVSSPLHFTLFFDYCSLLWTPIISLLEFLFHIDGASSPGLCFALIGSSLFSINIFSWRLPCWTFVCVPCWSLTAFVFGGLRAHLSLSHRFMSAFFLTLYSTVLWVLNFQNEV